MFPIFRQRLLIAAAFVIGGLIWIGIEPALSAADASGGVSVLDAHVGPAAAVGLILLAGLPALGLGLVVSASGNPLAGVFSVAIALMFVAVGGGPIDGWLWRHSLPGSYGLLLLEVLLWGGVAMGWLALVRLGRPRVRPRLRGLATEEHFGRSSPAGFPAARDWGAGLLCAVVGGTLANLMVQTTNPDQVIGSLLVAFAVGALVAELILPRAHPAPLLLSPIAAAVYGYTFVWLSYPGREAVLASWYDGSLPGLAMVLPIYYASTGLAGASLGIGLGQTVNHARVQAAADA